MTQLEFDRQFEVIVIEDGSDLSSEFVCNRFRESLNINYLYKENSGPGDSRNYGMARATGNYFLILDSDCLLPSHYLKNVDLNLNHHFVDAFGGPDAADQSFTPLQKAINYSMTSFLTTGGIRGGAETLGRFQPRSFNMGLSKKAFEATGGFGTIHPGEDPDLSIRLWDMGFRTALFKEAYVYHKRRISWRLFYKQVNKFGKVRVILNKWHPSTSKVTYWLPSLFCLFSFVSILLLIKGNWWMMGLILVYLFINALIATMKYGLSVGWRTVPAVLIQFIGYGIGFLESTIKINILRWDERRAFPQLFFTS